MTTAVSWEDWWTYDGISGKFIIMSSSDIDLSRKQPKALLVRLSCFNQFPFNLKFVCVFVPLPDKTNEPLLEIDFI